ncbi:hypothetical protein FRB99_004429 [Tulasnella sp. 403]|nr:hypothetical protein FRB99_004429 [Tulasnella sp. 403]
MPDPNFYLHSIKDLELMHTDRNPESRETGYMTNQVVLPVLPNLHRLSIRFYPFTLRHGALYPIQQNVTYEFMREICLEQVHNVALWLLVRWPFPALEIVAISCTCPPDTEQIDDWNIPKGTSKMSLPTVTKLILYDVHNDFASAVVAGMPGVEHLAVSFNSTKGSSPAYLTRSSFLPRLSTLAFRASDGGTGSLDPLQQHVAKCGKLLIDAGMDNTDRQILEGWARPKTRVEVQGNLEFNRVLDFFRRLPVGSAEARESSARAVYA